MTPHRSSPRRRRAPALTAAAAALAAFGAAALGACGGGGDAAAAAPADSTAGSAAGPPAAASGGAAPVLVGPENVVAVERAPISSGPALNGSLTPERSATLRAQVSGTITAVYAEAGQAVRRGQPLARVETTGIAEQAVSARAGVAAARNSFELAARNADRAERLLAAGAIASRDAEQARSAATGARSQLSTAQAQLALAQSSSATPPPPRRSPASSARAR
jgi:multidrug efflux pump subunit AcrA (membrane-fusion protein)